jgi:hypothetical protein
MVKHTRVHKKCASTSFQQILDPGRGQKKDLMENDDNAMAVVIGCNYPGTSAELGGCVNDALDMRDFFNNKCMVPRQNIHMMCDAGNEGRENSPTGQNILKMFDTMVRAAHANPGMRLFMSYSGHGTRMRDRSYGPGGHPYMRQDEADGYDEAICPTDYGQSGLIVDDLMRYYLVDRLPANCTLFFLCDACHSQGMLDSRFELTSGNNYRVTRLNPRVQAAAADVRVITGCESQQTSADILVPERKRRAGAMTTAFLGAVQDFETEANQNGAIPTVADFMGQMIERLRRRGMTQKPTLNSSRVIVSTRAFGGLFSHFASGASATLQDGVGGTSAGESGLTGHNLFGGGIQWI